MTGIHALLAKLKDEEVLEPPEDVQSRVCLVFNNLSVNNIGEKANEVMETMDEQFNPWLVQYIVTERASIEGNFHFMYAELIDHLQYNDFFEQVIIKTYRDIKILLRQEDVGSQGFPGRSVLKNLGHWLGVITLGRNRPIFYKDLDLKSLMYEAHNKVKEGSHGLLSVVVSFVAKVLQSCSKSRVFAPAQPWTMGILNVLAEFHRDQDVPRNVKLGIDVLLKNLNLDVRDFGPTTVKSLRQYCMETVYRHRPELPVELLPDEFMFILII